MPMKWSQINVPSANTAGTIALDLIMPTARNLEKRNHAGTIIRITRVRTHASTHARTHTHTRTNTRTNTHTDKQVLSHGYSQRNMKIKTYEKK